MLLVGVHCNVHVMQVAPPSFVCRREHPSVLLVGVKCNMHVVQVLSSSVCTLYIHLCFLCHAMCMQRRYSTTLCAPQAGICALSQSVMQRACNSDGCSMLLCAPHDREGILLQVVDSGAVEHSRAMCAIAPGFLIQSLCILSCFGC